VDDGLLSMPDATSATKVLTEAKRICQQGKLHLHKILSSEKEVLNLFSKFKQSVTLQDLDLNSDCLSTEITFGLMRNSEQDSFQFQVNLANKPNTRKCVLSNVVSVFDPLGLISPVSQQGKMVIQDLCKKQVDWEDSLDKSMLAK